MAKLSKIKIEELPDYLDAMQAEIKEIKARVGELEEKKTAEDNDE